MGRVKQQAAGNRQQAAGKASGLRLQASGRIHRIVGLHSRMIAMRLESHRLGQRIAALRRSLAKLYAQLQSAERAEAKGATQA